MERDGEKWRKNTGKCDENINKKASTNFIKKSTLCSTHEFLCDIAKMKTFFNSSGIQLVRRTCKKIFPN